MFGSVPLSKRKEASVFSPWRRAVFRTNTGSKQALSRNTLVVASVIPLSNPPNTPAIHIGSSVLHTIRSFSFSSRSTPSSVVNLVPVGKLRTITLFPLILSLSKECRGCPSSKRMKFVISTTLLIGCKPMAFKRVCNHSGDSWTLTPSIHTPAYRGQASGRCTSIEIPAVLLSAAKWATEGRV